MAEIPTMISFNSLARSGMPPAQRSSIERWYHQNIGSGDNARALAKLHVKAAGEGIRSTGESLVMGAILATIHSMSPTGLDIKKVPVDGVAAVFMGLAGIFAAQEEGAKDIANCGAAAAAIFSFRKTHDFLEARRASKPATAGTAVSPAKLIGKATFTGEPQGGGRFWKSGIGFGNTASMGEDPIIRMARSL